MMDRRVYYVAFRTIVVKEGSRFMRMERVVEALSGTKGEH